MKFIKKYYFDIIIAIIVIFFLYRQSPVILENFKQQGQVVSSMPVKILTETGAVQSTELLSRKKRILVFWATWCAPCKVELGRLNHLLEQGVFSSDDLLAIDIGESQNEVLATLRERSYQFKIALDESMQIAQKFSVESTPTILLVNEKNEVEWRASGLSPSLEFRVKSFFK